MEIPAEPAKLRKSTLIMKKADGSRLKRNTCALFHAHYYMSVRGRAGRVGRFITRPKLEQFSTHPESAVA